MCANCPKKPCAQQPKRGLNQLYSYTSQLTSTADESSFASRSSAGKNHGVQPHTWTLERRTSRRRQQLPGLPVSMAKVASVSMRRMEAQSEAAKLRSSAAGVRVAFTAVETTQNK